MLRKLRSPEKDAVFDATRWAMTAKEKLMDWVAHRPFANLLVPVFALHQ
jgi:hypothetical protein